MSPRLVANFITYVNFKETRLIIDYWLEGVEVEVKQRKVMPSIREWR